MYESEKPFDIWSNDARRTFKKIDSFQIIMDDCDFCDTTIPRDGATHLNAITTSFVALATTLAGRKSFATTMYLFIGKTTKIAFVRTVRMTFKA